MKPPQPSVSAVGTFVGAVLGAETSRRLGFGFAHGGLKPKRHAIVGRLLVRESVSSDGLTAPLLVSGGHR